MKSITHENRRRFTILTIVSVLVVAILTTTLVLLLKKDTTAPTNTIEVGKRIDTSLGGGGRKLLNASVWDGSVATGFGGGTGTEADPYLITNASELAYLSSTTTEENSNYEGVYFALTTDIDLNCTTTQRWTPIGDQDDWFSGVFDGCGHSVINVMLKFSSINHDYGFFGFVHVPGQVINLNVYYTGTISATDGMGGIAGLTGNDTLSYYGSQNVIIRNCAVYNLNITVSDNSLYHLGGIVGRARKPTIIENCLVESISITGKVSCGGIIGEGFGWTIKNCICTNSTIKATSSADPAGGIIGQFNASATSAVTIENCIVENTTIRGYYSGGIIGETYTGHAISINGCSVVGGTITGTAYAGGIIGSVYSSSANDLDIQDCYVDSSVSGATYAGGLYGDCSGTPILMNNLVQGSVYKTSRDTSSTAKIGGLGGYKHFASSTTIANNIVNATLKHYTGSYYYMPTASGDATNYYNSEKSHIGTAKATDGARTESQLKDASSYADWVDFGSHWIINDNINNGFPFPRAALSVAKITGFDGSGTQADPYQIKTTADLQGMQAYYNDYDMIDECWWKLVNSINIATDSNGLTINWCPIGYEGGVISGFNGHFDGNGKTISGLTITEQYENVGLFGKVASNATITNLNVTGTINWDQGKYVGGVVGLMEDGAMLTGCTFTGTITGYLNSGNHAIVGGLAGKYSTDAITGSANYDNYVYGANNYTTFTRFTATYTA